MTTCQARNCENDITVLLAAYENRGRTGAPPKYCRDRECKRVRTPLRYGSPVARRAGGRGGGQLLSMTMVRAHRAIQEFMGHSKIQTTFDTYGHLMPGSRDEVRERMDAYLESAARPSPTEETPQPTSAA